jgi:hypothetical protein
VFVAPGRFGHAITGTMRRAPSARGAYPLETNLVAHFARCLRRGDTQWGRVRIAFEFDYVGGYTDVLALSEGQHLVAFEAKLARWRDALHQAYRTRCFAHRSYVVLPTGAAHVAAQHEREFERRRVGLCSLSAERGIEVLLDALPSMPFQPWVATRAIAELASGGGSKSRCRQTPSSNTSRKQSARHGS